MITSGELEPDTPLSETRLAKHFAVSRTPVREALKELQAEGLVEIRAQVGTFVSRPSLQHVDEMVIVTGLLESKAAGLTAANPSDELLGLMAENLRDSEEAASRGDADAYALLVPRFHDLILSGSGNSTLRRLHKLLANQLAYPSLVRSSLHQPGRLPKSVAEHRSIYEAICAHDVERAEREMTSHVQFSHENTMRALRDADREITGDLPRAESRLS
ncbi:GntR family transcriptional regulator [Dactylosporangium roseum]